MADPSGEVALRRLKGRLARAEELRNRLAGLSGGATSPNGLIRVACTGEDALTELAIDPRALRLPATELAELIRTTARAAQQDLQTRVNRETAETFAGDAMMELARDPEAAAAKLAQLGELTNATATDAQALFARARQQLQP
jgi:DNA-binding protein YbaB